MVSSIKQFYLTHRLDPNRYDHFGVRVDLGIMAMKEYSTFLKAPGLKPHHQMQFGVISSTLNGEMQLAYAVGPQLIELFLKSNFTLDLHSTL